MPAISYIAEAGVALEDVCRTTSSIASSPATATTHHHVTHVLPACFLECVWGREIHACISGLANTLLMSLLISQCSGSSAIIMHWATAGLQTIGSDRLYSLGKPDFQDEHTAE
eukprot:4255766-Amphidinium_carterae.1